MRGMAEAGDFLILVVPSPLPERFLAEAEGHTLEALLPLVCMVGLEALTQRVRNPVAEVAHHAPVTQTVLTALLVASL